MRVMMNRDNFSSLLFCFPILTVGTIFCFIIFVILSDTTMQNKTQHGIVMMPVVENGRVKELKFDDYQGYVRHNNGQSTWTNSNGETRTTAMHLIFKEDRAK
jgi:hypothetical protein